MELIKLLYSTNNPRIDRTLRGVITLYEEFFPGRVRGYYLSGSFSDGTATLAADDWLQASDLDVYVVFKGVLTEAERAKALEVRTVCNSFSWLMIETIPRSEASIMSDGDVAIKTASQLLYGEDIRDQLPVMPADTYIQFSIVVCLSSLLFSRHSPPFLTFPLKHPDSQGEFYGYDFQYSDEKAAIESKTGTRILVTTVARIASVLVAMSGGTLAGRKSDGIRLYREQVSDEWANYVTAVYQKCKRQWGHLIPQDEQERAELRELCRQTPAFENHFLALCKDYFASQLKSNEAKNQLWAAQQLAKIVYNDNAINAALQTLANSDNAEVREAAKLALTKNIVS